MGRVSWPRENPPLVETLAHLWQMLIAASATSKQLVAPHAVQLLAEAARAAFHRSDPGALSPGRIIPDMLLVSALKLRDPVVLGVEVVTDNSPLHVGMIPWAKAPYPHEARNDCRWRRRTTTVATALR